MRTFHKVISTTFNKIASMQEVSIDKSKTQINPWMTRKELKVIKRKDKLFKNHKFYSFSHNLKVAYIKA